MKTLEKYIIFVLNLKRKTKANSHYKKIKQIFKQIIKHTHTHTHTYIYIYIYIYITYY